MNIYVFLSIVTTYLPSNLSNCFVVFFWMDAFLKGVGIPLGILPNIREQNKRSYFPRPGQS